MKSIFLMDIDTQRDFMLRSGAWHLPGAERLIPKLRRMFDFARRNGVSILSSAEIHAADDPEFREYPVHCVQGSEGQRKIDDTLLPRPLVIENRPLDRNLADVVRKHQQIIIQKQQFDILSNPVTERLLRVLPPYAIVFGAMTENGVRLAALGLRRLGVKAAVMTDAVAAVAKESGDKALVEMRSAGVEFTTVDAFLGALQGE